MSGRAGFLQTERLSILELLNLHMGRHVDVIGGSAAEHPGDRHDTPRVLTDPDHARAKSSSQRLKGNHFDNPESEFRFFPALN